MSYAGPPSQAEINRNKGRTHHANAYSSGNTSAMRNNWYEPQYTQQPSTVMEEQYSPDENDSGNIVVKQRKGGCAVVMSYSPPNEKDKKPWLSHRPQDSKPEKHRTKPYLSSSNRP
jgi:hypothetical protein